MGLHRTLALRLNSSTLVPGTVRELVGGRFFRTAGYRIIGTDQDTARRAATELDGWHRPRVAKRHDRLWHDGSLRPGSENLIHALRTFPGARTALEVGCGTGYNLSMLATQGVAAIGVDNSATMLALAGTRPVMRAEASALPVATASVDIVVDGSMLIHVLDWQHALAEQARAARMGVILHSVTITEAPTTYLFKRAYGYAVPEVAYNRKQLTQILSSHGLRLEEVRDDFPYDLTDFVGLPTRAQTWVLTQTR